jgi:predicted methyltransferase
MIKKAFKLPIDVPHLINALVVALIVGVSAGYITIMIGMGVQKKWMENFDFRITNAEASIKDFRLHESKYSGDLEKLNTICTHMNKLEDKQEKIWNKLEEIQRFQVRQEVLGNTRRDAKIRKDQAVKEKEDLEWKNRIR